MGYVPIKISGLFPIVPPEYSIPIILTLTILALCLPGPSLIRKYCSLIPRDIHTHEVRGNGEGRKVIVLHRHHTRKHSQKTVPGSRAKLSVGCDGPPYLGLLCENLPYRHSIFISGSRAKGVDQFPSKLSKTDQAPSPPLPEKSLPRRVYVATSILPWGLCVGFGSLNIMVRFATGLVF